MKFVDLTQDGNPKKILDDMSKHLTKRRFDILSTAITLGMVALTKKIIDKQYTKATGSLPPKDPSEENVPLATILIYSAATAAAGATAEILVRKFLAKQWKKMDGDLPDYLE
jgi:hypothetical protein